MKHTPGALRAAKLIARSDKLRPLVFGDVLRETAAQDWAEVIDRETAATELLEALEALPLDSFGDDMSNCDAADFIDHAGAFFQAMCLARVAIRKARGEA
jgi:hypothetical protein